MKWGGEGDEEALELVRDIKPVCSGLERGRRVTRYKKPVMNLSSGVQTSCLKITRRLG